MLVLSRKQNQEILINGNIKVSVLKIKGNVVRIGIEAPAEVSIKRGELVAAETGVPTADLPTAETTAGTDEGASCTLSIDAETLEVSEVAEETAGYCLLPLPSESALVDGDNANLAHFQTQFPETLQRGRCCESSRSA